MEGKIRTEINEHSNYPPKLQIRTIPHLKTTMKNKTKMLQGCFCEIGGNNRTDKIYLQYLTGDMYLLANSYQILNTTVKNNILPCFIMELQLSMGKQQHRELP